MHDDTTSPLSSLRRRRRWPELLRAAGWGLLPALFIAACFILPAKFVPVSQSALAEEQVCDRAVTTLLESRDLVEIQRAGWLAQLLRCNVYRRLPVPGAAP